MRSLYPRHLLPARALLLTTLFGCAVICGAAAAKTTTDLEFDAAGSTVIWRAQKVVGDKHFGKIKIKEGRVSLGPNGEPVAARVVMDMRSITNEDLGSAKWNAKLIKHLKSDDFFAVSGNPVAVLAVTGVRKTADDSGHTHMLKGDLTIRGVTRTVSFPARIELRAGEATASGELRVDRTDFGVRYGSGRFFQNLGDRMIADEFVLEFEIRAGGGEVGRDTAASGQRTRSLRRSEATAEAR
jgi:polyisoprenoid-binding protein YceI